MPSPQPPAQSRGIALARATAPYLLTALIAVAVSLLLQSLLIGPAQQPEPLASAPTFAPTRALSSEPAPLPTHTAVPLPTRLRPDERVLGQELLDLRDLSERRASFVYLLKAEAQIRLAEEELTQNNLEEVDRTLLDVDVAFTRAYERSADAGRSPILQLREQLSLIHDDLYVRPEGIDQRLKRLRQNALSLVDEVP